FNDNERAEVWHKVLKNEFKVVIGARSAVFLPFRALGLIIVDEEHENSYKQYDPAPRYHARDTAIYLAHLHYAQVLLGYANPSAVFLPFRDLGLIIVDEEHENSYKQYDPAPRYHARDTAIYLAHLHYAKVLLGSATPSVESYYNAKANKYGLVELLQRFGEAQ